MTNSSRWWSLIAAIVGLGLGYGLATAERSIRNEGHPLAAAPVAPGDAGPRVREILAGRDRLQRLTELAALLHGLKPEALPAVLEAFGTAPLDQGDPEFVQLAIWWAGFDPQAAYRWTSADWRGADALVLAGIFQTWAASDPKEAWGSALTLSFQGHREFCTDAVISGWDESGRPGLIEFVRALPGQLQQRAAEVLARRRVVALGAEKAVEWVNALPPDDFRTLMTPRIASAVTIADPSVAATWAEPQIAGAAAAGARPTGLPRRIATRWILRDPEAAMTWLASLPAGNDRDDGVTEAFRDWLRRDPLAAGAWIERTEMQRWNEPAFGHYARGAIAGQDPRKALEIVGRLTDEPLRNYLTTVIARGWLERDRDAADAWIRQANLPEGVRKRAYMVSRHKPPQGPRRSLEADLIAPGALPLEGTAPDATP